MPGIVPQWGTFLSVTCCNNGWIFIAPLTVFFLMYANSSGDSSHNNLWIINAIMIVSMQDVSRKGSEVQSMVMKYYFTTLGGAFVEAAAGGLENEAKMSTWMWNQVITFCSSRTQALPSAPGCFTLYFCFQC